MLANESQVSTAAVEVQPVLQPVLQRVLQRMEIPSLPLDSGATLRNAVIAFHLDGTLSAARDNVVLVLHALTGSADAMGDWWRGLIGPGLAIDTLRFAVLSPNLIGSCHGSTGPAGDGEFPAITTRDMARAVGVLLERLGVPRVALVTGGSLGGMVALEFAATFPGRARAAAVFAAPARQGAAAIGWSHVQREALQLAGANGLALARQVAMLTYRTASGLDERFSRRIAIGGGFDVQHWLRAHGERFTARFNAASYGVLLDAMDSHDVGRGRGGVSERLRASGTALTGIGIPGDIFAPAEDVERWVDQAGGTYRTIVSPHGHDAFLLEQGQVAAIIGEVL